MVRAKKAGLIFTRLRLFSRLFYRRLINRCPGRLRVLGGPILGGLIGMALGGLPGVFIGLLLGYLLGELLAQSSRDRKILEYFRNPGVLQFYESEPGLAAWCALAVLIFSQDAADAYADFHGGKQKVSQLTAERILKQVILTASSELSGKAVDLSLAEHFSRLALSVLGDLNSDLLAESLCARRASPGDAANLSDVLYRLAIGKRAKALAAEIRLILDPAWDESEEAAHPNGENQKDPWKILGLRPGASLWEIKAQYRRLAKLFHPDELQILDEMRRETAARAFVAIKEAYKQVTTVPPVAPISTEP